MALRLLCRQRLIKTFASQSPKCARFLLEPDPCVKHCKIILPKYYSSPAYDADGKTKVSILNNDAEMGLMINSYSQVGFRLNNNMVIVGPMAIFSKSVLSWNVNSPEDINEDSLSIFYTLEPKIDVLVLGIGDQPVTPAFSKRIMEYMKQYRVNVEILRTEQACATFNFLNAENRIVAAALIPPVHFMFNENDVLQSKLRQKKLYEIDD